MRGFRIHKGDIVLTVPLQVPNGIKTRPGLFLLANQNSKPFSAPTRSNTGMYSMGAAALIRHPPS